ncbi:MAG: hypothetical protein PVG22_11255 [Chromatiales bacterium]
MNKTLKLLPLAMAASMLALPVSAIQLESDGKDLGQVEGEFKVMSVLSGEHNGYDPTTGTAYLVKLKYLTPSWHNAKLGIGFYDNGDLWNLTDFDAAKEDPSEDKVARGMFVTDDGSEKAQLGELYLSYAGNDWAIDAGRQLYGTPLTTIAYSTIPNFHTAYGVSTTALSGWKLSFDQVTQMSFGARAMTDWGLIGEGTQTAGATVQPNLPDIGQAEFHDISLIATGDTTANTDGISVFGATYSGIKGAEITAWDYYADDISNSFYLAGSYGFPVSGLKLKLLAQYLYQTDVGNLVEENNQGGTGNFADGIDFDLFGLKAVLKGSNWLAFAAYNKSWGDTGFFNSWGGDPAYTSSIFSRNEYRKNVSAYKIGVKYNFMKNLFGMLSYANYGESDSNGKLPGLGIVTPITDANEMDLVFVYKPWKELMLKLFYANRTSEYDGTDGKELTQSHTRLVASYSF